MATPKAGTLRISKEAEEVLRSDPAYERLARANVEETARKLKLLDELAKDSKISERDAIALGREIRRGVYRRYRAKK